MLTTAGWDVIFSYLWYRYRNGGLEALTSPCMQEEEVAELRFDSRAHTFSSPFLSLLNIQNKRRKHLPRARKGNDPKAMSTEKYLVGVQMSWRGIKWQERKCQGLAVWPKAAPLPGWLANCMPSLAGYTYVTQSLFHLVWFTGDCLWPPSAYSSPTRLQDSITSACFMGCPGFFLYRLIFPQSFVYPQHTAPPSLIRKCSQKPATFLICT